MHSIALIVVDYKTPEKTLKYISRFLDACINSKNLHLEVVDNSGEHIWKDFCNLNHYPISENLSIQIPMCNCSWNFQYTGVTVTVVEANGNLGYGKGNNLGADFAMQFWDVDRLLISNNDLEFPQPIDLCQFEDVFFEHPDVAVVGPMITTPENIQQSPHMKRNIYDILVKKYFYLLFMPFTAEKLKLISDVVETNQSGYQYYVTGCFLYVDAFKFKEVGMFDSTTFLYGEEKILAEILEQHGYRMYFLSELRIIHNHGQSIKNAISVLDAAKIGFESQIYYFDRYIHATRWELALAKLSFKLYTLLYPIKCKWKSRRR